MFFYLIKALWKKSTVDRVTDKKKTPIRRSVWSKIMQTFIDVQHIECENQWLFIKYTFAILIFFILYYTPGWGEPLFDIQEWVSPKIQ